MGCAEGKLAAGSGNGTIKTWDVASETCLCALEGHTNAVETQCREGSLRSEFRVHLRGHISR